jgi:hypothetical protein
LHSLGAKEKEKTELREGVEFRGQRFWDDGAVAKLAIGFPRRRQVVLYRNENSSTHVPECIDPECGTIGA